MSGPAPPRPRVLVIAGHDPSGGAGVDADRDALRDIAVDLDVVLTARTDQDDGGVRSIGAVPSAQWFAQARGFLRRAGAIKFGLLPGLDAVRAAAALARDATDRPVVVDPVIAASSGPRFLDTAAVAALREELLPAGVVLTPNLDEAAELTGMPRAALDPSEARVSAARTLLELGAAAVLLKGGHATEPMARDLVLERGAEPAWLERPRYPGTLRGTGCRLATALAAHLALGTTFLDSARAATELVAERLRSLGQTPRAPHGRSRS